MDPGGWAPDTTLPPLRCHPQQLWAGPEAQMGQDRQGRGTCRRPPPRPFNSSVDPVLRASPSPHRCGLCAQGCDPTNHRPALPPPPEAPGGPVSLPWCPGLAVLLPRANAEPGSEVSGPKSPPRTHIPRAPGPAGSQQDPPSQADEELLSSHPGRLPQLWREEPVISAKINSRPTVYLS